MLSLTPQQQLVVAHNRGPALVFATAGAGKTTTMTARIERLVRQGVFPARQILATSFNRDAAESIRRSLKRRGVEGVQVQTLHGLGYGIVRQAARQGLLPADTAGASGFDGADRRILWAALDEARRRKVEYRDDLNRLDQDDFLTFVARNKGNLAYADLGRAELSPAARRIASQAEAPDDRAWYLPFFRLFEDVRRSRGWISYDDMVTSAWELLMAHPGLLKSVQSAYACLLVDEFQDVNLAQAELVELIAQPHGNLMVIGDDDQTIYEWRGAQPRFILEFEQRHKAKVYFLEENFRCRAGQVALANGVIVHSPARSPKRVKLTRGFDGETVLHRPADESAQAAALVEQVQRALRDGRRADEIAVLVRLFAQTAPIEAALLDAGIAYRVEGEQPFYRREECALLLAYIRLGQIEADLLAGRPLTDDAIDEFQALWPRLRNRPNRYLPKAVGEEIGQWVAEKQQPISAALRAFAGRSSGRSAEQMAKFAADLAWLAGQVQPQRISDRPAQALLGELESRLGYREELLRASGDESLGRAKAGAVDALLGLAQGQGSVERFLRFVEQLESSHQRRKWGAALVTLTTIYRAKGLEWPVVLVPGVSEGTLPYARKADCQSALPEERRLLYVAITRAQERLHLFAPADRPLSRFLQEADAESVLAQVGSIRHALSLPPARWGAAALQAAAVTAKGLGFYAYFAFWWSGDEIYRQQMAQTILDRLNLPAEDRRFWQALAEGKTPASAPGQAAPPPARPRQVARPAPPNSRPRFQRTRQTGAAWAKGIGAFFAALRKVLRGV